MKKIKFLSGVGAMFALAMVAFGTTFTSCTKEEFNVDVKPVEPINAQAIINPIVLFVEDGVTTDVTTLATITPAAPITLTGAPELAASVQTINAEYDGVSASITVQVPTLKAGQLVSLTPTIVLTRTTETKTEIVKNEVEVVVDPIKKEVIKSNPSNYWYETTAKYTEKSGNKVGTPEILTTDELEVATINSFANTLANTYAETEKTININLWATSQTEVTVTYTIAKVEYVFARKTTTIVTKADNVETEKIGSVAVETFSTQVDVKEYQQIPGHDAPKPGHEHGHGHGGEYAGGGIVIPD